LLIGIAFLANGGVPEFQPFCYLVVPSPTLNALFLRGDYPE